MAPKLAAEKAPKKAKPMKVMKAATALKAMKAMKAMKSGKMSKIARPSTKASVMELREFLADDGFGAKSGGEEEGPRGSKDPKKVAKTVKKAVKKAVLRRPAAAVKRPTSCTTLAVADEGQPEERRDRMKNYYFMDSLKSDTLDPELKEMWEKVKGNRKKETMLINNVMRQQVNGKFKPDKSSPGYQELRTLISTSYWRDEQKGIPRSLAVAKFKSEAALDNAVAAGEVVESEDGGQRFYSWRSIVVGRAGQRETKAEIKTSGVMDKLAYDKMSKMLDQVGWNFKFTQKQQQASLKDRELPKEAVDKMTAAQLALQKVSKQAVGTLQSMKDPAYHKNEFVKQAKDKLSEYLGQLRTTENTLESCVVMGKNPDGIDITCEGVLKLLAQAAGVLESSFAHIKICNGLLRGSKVD